MSFPMATKVFSIAVRREVCSTNFCPYPLCSSSLDSMLVKRAYSSAFSLASCAALRSASSTRFCSAFFASARVASHVPSTLQAPVIRATIIAVSISITSQPVIRSMVSVLYVVVVVHVRVPPLTDRVVSLADAIGRQLELPFERTCKM